MAKKATAPKSADQVTLDLIEEINKRKAEIAKLDKPRPVTNLSFSYNEGDRPINLNVESNVKNLICMAAFLQEKEKSYKDTATALGVEEVPAFTWSGYAAKDWIEDIKNRINKVQIGLKKKKLEALETRLEAVISPELKRDRELKRIQEELNG